VQQAVNVVITHLETLLLPHDESHDIQRSIKKISEPGKSATSQLKPGTQHSLNVCAKAILFSNT